MEEGTLYVYTGAGVIALEPETGRPRWSFDVNSVPMRHWADAQRIYVVSQEESLLGRKSTLHALARSTGREDWARTLKGGSSSVVVRDGRVYADGTRIHALDAATGDELGSIANKHGQSAGRVPPQPGHLSAIDAATGAR